MGKLRNRAVMAALGLGMAASSIAAPVAAFADFINPTQPPATSASIVVSDVEESVTAHAYRIIVAQYDADTYEPSSEPYVWAPEVYQWVQENYPQYVGVQAGDVYLVDDAFSSIIGDDGTLTDANRPVDNGAASFYDDLAAAIKAGDVTPVEAGSCEGEGTIDNLALGSYLVLIDSGMNVYRPSVANLVPTWDEGSNAWTVPESASIIVKSSEVPVTKKIIGEGLIKCSCGETFNSISEWDDHVIAALGEDEYQHTYSVQGNSGSAAAGYAIGDTVSFEVSAGVPVYPDNVNNPYLAVSDVLPIGLTLDSASISVFGVKDGAEAKLSSPDAYSASTDAAKPTTGEADLLVNFVYSAINGYDSIVVRYDAKVNGQAVVGSGGNVNTAEAIFVNDPYLESGYAETPEVTAKVLTYGIEVLKVGDADVPLSGAKFKIDGKTWVQEEPGVYHLATADESGVEEIQVADDGTLKLEGLALGEYDLVETKAPDGYTKLANPVRITISDANGDGQVDGDTETDGFAFAKIQNTHAFTLPVTGGPGTVMWTVVGCAAAAGGVALALKLKRDGKSDAAQA